jgi:hypothetical protein
MSEIRRGGILPLVILFTVVLLATGLVGCGDEEADDESAATTATTSTTGSRSTTDVPHSVTVTAFTCPIDTAEVSIEPDEGMVLARVDLKIVNEGDEDYEANANMFVVEDNTGEDYVHYIFYEGDDAMGSSTDSDVVAPGEELEVALLFEVPAGTDIVGVREGLGYPNSGDLYELP